MKKLAIILVVLCGAAGVLAIMGVFGASADAADRALIVEELGVDPKAVQSKRIVENENLGYYCVFFRVDQIDAKLRRIVADSTRYHDSNSRHPWTIFLPFHSKFT